MHYRALVRMSLTRLIAGFSVLIGSHSAAGQEPRVQESFTLADGRITFVAPQGFTALTNEELATKFPRSGAPRQAVGNVRRTTSIGYDLLEQRAPSPDLEEGRKFFTASFEQALPNLKWVLNEVRRVGNRDWAYLEFTAPAADQDLHCIVLVSIHEGRILIFNFNSTVFEFPRVEQALRASMASITTRAPTSFIEPARAPVVPLVPGLTIGLAVSSPIGVKPSSGDRFAEGDYEAIVSVTEVSADGIEETNRSEALDQNRQALHLNIDRHVLKTDLDKSRLQILGFYTGDAHEIPGSTSLGPSVGVVQDLLTSGHAIYSLRNYTAQETFKGTLTRIGLAPVPFSVLVNGRRTELPAIRAGGLLRSDDKSLLCEQYILDHPQHPISLRVTHGGGFVREVVRIDFPATQEREIEEALTTACRVEVPGIYFDFGVATLNPRSRDALKGIAGLLRRHPEWQLRIEGHTDNIGTDSYNVTLSTERATTVKAELVREFSVVPERLTAIGFGARQPVENNDSLAGRARNRRVELARDCAAIKK